MKIKPPADVTDFEGGQSSGLDSKSGRNYAKAQLIDSLYIYKKRGENDEEKIVVN